MPELQHYSGDSTHARAALTSRVEGSRPATKRPSNGGQYEAGGIDLAVFEALYESHGARMQGMALNLLGNRCDAEDAVQEAFLRAYKNRHSFRSDAAVWTWVYRILLNTCYDIGRGRAVRRDSRTTDTDAAARLPCPAGDGPMRLTLQRALNGLSPIYREVFVLCEVAGYTHREVATMLDIPEGTSKGRLFEARRQLKRVLAAVPRVSAPASA